MLIRVVFVAKAGKIFYLRIFSDYDTANEFFKDFMDGYLDVSESDYEEYTLYGEYEVDNEILREVMWSSKTDGDF